MHDYRQVTSFLPSITVTPTPSPSVDPVRGKLLSSTPTAVLLLKKVVPVIAQEWLQIGVHLGMEMAILKTFKATESYDLKLCCLEMFECWLTGSKGTGASPRTWSTVLSAVGDCLGHDVADSIERALVEERNIRSGDFGEKAQSMLKGLLRKRSILNLLP